MEAWDKLTIVVRSDLTPGQQIAQALHAGFAFATEHPEVFRDWMQRSNTVAIVHAPEIEPYVHKAHSRSIDSALFREPDRDDQLTALALAPSPATRQLVRNLALAG